MAKSVRHWFLALVALSALVSIGFNPTQAYARSVHSEFVETWAARDERYLRERDAADALARQQVQAFWSVLQSGGKNVEPQLAAMRDSIDAVAYLDGRGRYLRSFRERMSRKPSAAASEVWVQEQVEMIQSDARRADALMSNFRKPHPEWTLNDSLNAFEAAITASAQVRGRVDELILIDQNLSSYYRAKGTEDTERKNSRRALLGALGLALRQSASQSPPPPTMWRARCSTYGNQTNCTGN